jgi:hypothetical protein
MYRNFPATPVSHLYCRYQCCSTPSTVLMDEGTIVVGYILVKYWSTVVVQYEFFSPNSNGNTQQKMRVETSDLKYHTSDAPPTVSYLPALRYSKPCSWSRSPLESTSSFGHDRVRGTGTSYRYHTHHASSTRLTRHLSSNRNVCDAVLLFV